MWRLHGGAKGPPRRRVEVTGPPEADGGLPSNRFGHVQRATASPPADGLYLVALPPTTNVLRGAQGSDTKRRENDIQCGFRTAADVPVTAAARAAEHRTVGLKHLALDWLDADAAPGEVRSLQLLGSRQRLVEQTADIELVCLFIDTIYP